MKKENKMNNKGFSLVELIIVIAIMAVLIGVLAPQYMGYVERSRISADVQNAQQIAAAVAVQLADDEMTGTTTDGFTIPASGATTTETANASGWDDTDITAAIGEAPDVKVDSTYFFQYVIDENASVTVNVTDGTNVVELYPTTPASGDWFAD